MKVRRPLIVAFIWLLPAGQQPGVFASLDKTSPKPLAPVVWNQNLIRVDPGLATLLQRPWAPPCWNLLLRSTHPKAGSLSCPLTSSTFSPGHQHEVHSISERLPRAKLTRSDRKKWGHQAFSQSSRCWPEKQGHLHPATKTKNLLQTLLLMLMKYK